MQTNPGEGFLDAARRREALLSHLARMSRQERLRSARHGRFDRWERSLWAARFPDEAPLLNGEYEWIALGLADLD
jgi:hypothetical protein